MFTEVTGAWIIISLLLFGWVLGILNTLISDWFARESRYGWVHMAIIYVSLFIVMLGLVLLALNIVFWSFLGGLIGAVFAGMAYLGAPYWVMITFGILLGGVFAIWLTLRPDPAYSI